MLKKILAVCLFLLLVPSAAGCAEAQNTPVMAPAAGGLVPEREAPVIAEPEDAISAIYASMEDPSAESLSAGEIGTLIGLEPDYFDDAYVYYSDVKHGLADIAIIKPNSGHRDDVRTALYVFKEQRIDEFTNYNILDSRTIAQDAVIFDQGEYVIMLMTADNEAAKEIVDQYIPQ